MQMPLVSCLAIYQTACTSLMLWVIFQNSSRGNCNKYIIQSHRVFDHLLLCVEGHTEIFYLGLCLNML